MTHCAHFLIALILPAALAPCAGAQAQAVKTRLVVRLPADAQLWLNDAASQQRGERRLIDTPPLEPGYDYSYTLKAELGQGGQALRVVKTITFQAGATVNIDLTKHFEQRAGNGGQTPSTPAKAASSNELTREEKEVVELTNREREKAGLTPFKVNTTLSRAARTHSENMARLEQLAHTLEGKGPAERLQDLGYRLFGFGENCAAGQRTPAEAIGTWLQSPGHRANMLNGSYTEIGVGLATSANGTPYWTQVFATPAE